MPCAFAGCASALPAPFDPRLDIEVHAECLAEWWRVTGPYPKPIVILARGGVEVVVGRGRDAPVVTPDDDAPDVLRKRGVFTAPAAVAQ